MIWVRAGAVLLLAATFCLTFLVDPWQDELVSDVPLYRAYAEVFLDGVMPYREIGFEYPPLAAPLIALPGLVSVDPETYRYAFAVLAFLLAVGVMFATGRLAALGGAPEWPALLVVALVPLATGAMLRTHFDLAPVLCLVAGLAAIASGRSRSGFALLGVGGAIKLFPLAAVPVAAAWLVGQRCRGEAVGGLAIAGAVVALAAGAGVGISADGAREAVDYHVDRPVQIESLPATILNGIEEAGGRAPAARPQSPLGRACSIRPPARSPTAASGSCSSSSSRSRWARGVSAACAGSCWPASRPRRRSRCSGRCSRRSS